MKGDAVIHAILGATTARAQTWKRDRTPKLPVGGTSVSGTICAFKGGGFRMVEPGCDTKMSNVDYVSTVSSIGRYDYPDDINIAKPPWVVKQKPQRTGAVAFV